LAARQTSRLRIGPGTAICGTRIPPVQVAAVATLNRIAPGRVFLGIGTGNTAMRSMGQRPMRIAEFAEYLRVLAALLARRDHRLCLHRRRPTGPHADARRPGYMNLAPRIPLYVSGFGPRAMALAGEYGDGLGLCDPAARRRPIASAGACPAGRCPGRPRPRRLSAIAR
jgi:alkanesulfonate monooxygenase SsuD/methylene tetrahydromethanopterin reductase-like flavin-dependent oxidoreductase (luciferase family)